MRSIFIFAVRVLVSVGLVLQLATAGVLAHTTTQIEPAQVKEHDHSVTPASTTAPGNDQWDPRFGLPGLYDGKVTAAAVGPDGSIYVGGAFDGRVARWDGERWHRLGQGLDQAPEQLLVDGATLYAVGAFSKAGTVSAKGIARWDGAAWSRVGSGVGPKDRHGSDGRLNAIAILGNQLYVGGAFARIDGVSALNIARWDGAQWHSLARGVADLNWEESELEENGQVYALAVAHNTLYAAGNFDGAGNSNGTVRVNNIAAWNGSSWSDLGKGVGKQDSTWFDNGVVHTIAISGNTIYVGGLFEVAGEQTANNIARWHNGAWQPLGAGLTADDTFWDPFKMVRTVLVKGNDVYVGGAFDYAGGQAIPLMARWNGAAWSAVANDFHEFGKGEVNAIVAGLNGSIYAGGEFVTINDLLVNNIAENVGSHWYPLGQGVTKTTLGDTPGYGYAIATDDDGNVYVGGDLRSAGGIRVNHIARWDGTGWSTLGSGVNGAVHAIVAAGDDLYVAGDFTQAGNVAANHVARWNRTTGQWSALGAGINGSVYALAYSDGILYAGGGFTSAGGALAYDVAYWDGAQWHPFGDNFRIFEISRDGSEAGTTVYALAVSGDDVVVGGRFQTIHKIGTNTQITSNYELVNNVVIWNQTTDEWRQVGPWTATVEPGVTTDTHSGISIAVHALAIAGSNLYIGGRFNLAGTVAASNIVRWHAPTNTWHALGGGVSGLESTLIDPVPVASVTVIGNKLAVGGYFTSAGNSGARYVALYDTLTGAWQPLGSGMAWYNDKFTAVLGTAATADSIYVSGKFDKAGGVHANGFARWAAPEAVNTITQGGGILNGEGLTLQFPAGALATSTKVYATSLFGAAAPAPSGQSIVRSVRLEAWAGAQQVKNAANPFTLRISYTSAELAALGITNPGTLNLARWNGAAWEPMLPCNGCSVDTTNRAVTVVTNHLSDFVLIGQLTLPETPASHRIYLPLTVK
jgi:trimeric autotransporter adhesin